MLCSLLFGSIVKSLLNDPIYQKPFQHAGSNDGRTRAWRKIKFRIILRNLGGKNGTGATGMGLSL